MTLETQTLSKALADDITALNIGSDLMEEDEPVDVVG